MSTTKILGEYDACTPQRIRLDPEVRKRIIEHLDTVVSLFEQLFPAHDNLVLNKALVQEAVESCMCDVYRLKFFRGIFQEDAHKQAAFLMVWLAKVRPFQLKSVKVKALSEIYANEVLAIHIGLGILDVPLGQLRAKHEQYIRNLIYLLHYHSCSPEQLASELFLLERAL